MSITPDMAVNIILEALPDCIAIYRFGSWGSDAERHDSDIDLAILPAKPLKPLKRWELAQRIASKARRNVDLVDLLSASTVIRMQAAANGERLYFSDFIEAERFEDMVFSSYARLNEERHEILKDVTSRGSVYGK